MLAVRWEFEQACLARPLPPYGLLVVAAPLLHHVSLLPDMPHLLKHHASGKVKACYFQSQIRDLLQQPHLYRRLVAAATSLPEH